MVSSLYLSTTPRRPRRSGRLLALWLSGLIGRCHEHPSLLISPSYDACAECCTLFPSTVARTRTTYVCSPHFSSRPSTAYHTCDQCTPCPCPLPVIKTRRREARARLRLWTSHPGTQQHRLMTRRLELGHQEVTTAHNAHRMAKTYVHHGHNGSGAVSRSTRLKHDERLRR